MKAEEVAETMATLEMTEERKAELKTLKSQIAALKTGADEAESEAKSANAALENGLTIPATLDETYLQGIRDKCVAEMLGSIMQHIQESIVTASHEFICRTQCAHSPALRRR